MNDLETAKLWTSRVLSSGLVKALVARGYTITDSGTRTEEKDFGDAIIYMECGYANLSGPASRKVRIYQSRWSEVGYVDFFGASGLFGEDSGRFESIFPEEMTEDLASEI